MRTEHHVLGALSGVFRVSSVLLSQWKLAALVALFFIPTGPHLRWESTYTEAFNHHRIYSSCTYIGARGMRVVEADNCPLIAWLPTYW